MISGVDLIFLTSFVAMFCSQKQMSWLYLDFIEWESSISPVQQIFFRVFNRIKVKTKWCQKQLKMSSPLHV